MVDTRFPVSLHIMTGLANYHPKLVNSEQLAYSIQTNASFIRKIVVNLSAAGLVESVRGKTGGIRLAKKAKDITLDQIYRAVTDTTLLALPKKTPNKTCEIACGMGDVLCQITREVEDNALKLLSKKTLQDVLDQVKG